MEVEISAMKAKLLKAELRIGSLEEALEGKTRENKELGAICDELIQKIDAANKVGGQGEVHPLKMMDT
jgi:soluble cytochrome b562